MNTVGNTPTASYQASCQAGEFLVDDRGFVDDEDFACAVTRKRVRASAAGRSSPSAAAPNSETAATRSARLWKEVTPRELTRHHPVAAELLGLDDSSTPSVSGLAGAAQTHT